jgi:hypothetical protein
VFASLRTGALPLEEALKAAVKYQQTLEAAAVAGQAFVDCLSKVLSDLKKNIFVQPSVL